MTEEKKQKRNIGGGLPKGKMPKNKFSFYWIYGLIAITFIALTFSNWDESVKKVDWGELKVMLHDQDVEKIVVVNQEDAEIYLSKEALNESKYEDVKNSGYQGKGTQYTYTIGAYDAFKADVEKAPEGLERPIYIRNEKRPNWTGDILS